MLNESSDGLGGGLESWRYSVKYFDNGDFLCLLLNTLCELGSLCINYVLRNQSCLSFSCLPRVLAHLLKVEKVNQTYKRNSHRNKDRNTPSRPLCWKHQYFRQSIDRSSTPDKQGAELKFGGTQCSLHVGNPRLIRRSVQARGV